MMKLFLIAVAVAAATGSASADPVGNGVVTAQASDTPSAAEVPPSADPASAAPVTGLFVGSSSISRWDLAHSFPAANTVNHGVSGATVRDILTHYDQAVAGVRPDLVVVYVGENDVAYGDPPGRVVADLLTLLGRLHADMPQARIVYLSIKPSPLRWKLYPAMATVNASLKASAGGAFYYVDVGTVLLDSAGKPDARFFDADGLHLNASGYALWNAILLGWLVRVSPVETAAAPAAVP